MSMSRLDQLSQYLVEQVRDREPGLIVPDHIFTDLGTWHKPPKVLVKQTQSGVLCVEFPGLEQWRSASEVSMSSIVEETWPQERVSHLRHDYTAGFFCRSLDTPLRSVFKVCRDDNDNLTPDNIMTVGDVVLVHEFATTKSTLETSSIEAFKSKLLRYAPALSHRALAEGKVVVLTITVVSPKTVMSNLPLSMDDVSELCVRFLVARSMVWQLEQQGVLVSDEEKEDSEKAERARMTMAQIKFNWEFQNEHFPNCDESVYEASRSQPNKKYVVEQVLAGFQNAEKRLREDHFLKKGENLLESERLDLNLEECAQAINDHVIKTEQDRSFKPTCTMSSVIPIPWWVPNRGTGSNNISQSPAGEPNYMPSLGTSDETTFQHWNSAWEFAKQFPERMTEESVLDELYEARSAIPENIDLSEGQKVEMERLEKLMGRISKPSEAKTRSCYRRVNVRVSPRDEKEAAKRGLRGKKFAHDNDVKAHHEQSQLPFSLDNYVEDIDLLLESSQKLFTSVSGVRNSYDRDLLPHLAEQAYALHRDGVGDPWIKLLSTWLSTDLGKWCSFVSDLGTELAISMKQHCKGNQMILKKLRHFDVYVLIRPTSTKSSVFYSLMTFQVNLTNDPSVAGSVFKQAYSNGQIYWTEFNSVDSSKLTNMVKCRSIMYTMLSYWLEFYGLKFWEVKLTAKTREMEEVWKMVTTCLMIILDDKTKTEEIITTSRYVFMEGFVAQPAVPKPHKMLSKLPEVLRSRLQVWLMHRMFESMRLISRHPFAMTWDEGRPVWFGLFNMFTQQSLREPMQLVSCFYLGYLKNKEESPQGNSSSKLYEKVMEYESRKPGTNLNLGWGDPGLNDIKFHEFSRSFLLYCADSAMKKLETMYGPRVKAQMTEDILYAIGNYDLEQFATLKASATYDQSMYDYDPKKKYHRAKVVEFVVKNSHKATHIHELLLECLEGLEQNTCLHIDLFKKAQHGGIREIYVLGPRERLVQLCLELIARTICRRFPSETMMNPKNKTDLPQRHNKDAKMKCGPKFMTTATSDDAAKWNQGHYVSKFAMLLCRFTDSVLHPFIMRACALFTRKIIKIDDQLLKIFAKYEERVFRSEHIELMHAAFRGRGDERYGHVEQGKTFLKTETGMLQGILHYASSLLHTVYQEFMLDLIEARFKHKHAILKRKNTNLKPHVTVMQSSDDSSVMISFPVSSSIPEATSQGMVLSWMCFQVKKELGLLLGIYPSEKCTTNTPWIVEFNSEFFFMSDLIRPLFRWVAAANGLSEHETLAGRQEEMSSNLTNVLGGGGTTSLTANVQLSQMMLHYQILGASTSLVFGHYSLMLEEVPDPSLGFFLLDHPFLAGLGGFKYNLYLAVKKTRLGLKYKRILKGQDEAAGPRAEKGMRIRTLETTKAGSLVESTIISMSTRKKWLALMERMGLPETWKEDLMADQRVLYEKAHTPEQLRLRLSVFVHSPGVISSISSSGTVVRLVALAAYALTRPVVQDRTDWYCDANLLFKKQSLLATMAEAHCESRMLEEPITLKDLQALFPQREDYDDLERVGENFSGVTGSSVRPHRPRITTRVQVTGSAGGAALTLQNVVEDRWYGYKKYMVAPRTMEQLWEAAKLRIPWLEDTPEQTLISSPFTEPVSLRNFIVGDPIKSRNVAMSGVPVKRGSGLSNLFTMVAENFAPNFKLGGSTDTVARSRSEKFFWIRHALALVAQGPFNPSEKVKMLREILHENRDLTVDAVAARSRRNCLAIMQDFVINGNMESTIQMITDHRLGALGSYVLRQKYARPEDVNPILGEKPGYYDHGIWRGVYDRTFIEVHVYRGLCDSSVSITGVMVSSTDDLNNVFKFLKEWASENGCDNDRHYWSAPPGLCGERVTRMFRFSSCPLDNGVAVHLEPRLRIGVTADAYAAMTFTFRNGVMRIEALDENPFVPERWTTLLSYRCRDNDIDVTRQDAQHNLTLVGRVANPFVLPWLNCMPVDTDLFDELEKIICARRGTSTNPRWSWDSKPTGIMDWKALADKIRELSELELRRRGILTMASISGTDISASPDEPPEAVQQQINQDYLTALAAQGEEEGDEYMMMGNEDLLLKVFTAFDEELQEPEPCDLNDDDLRLIVEEMDFDLAAHLDEMVKNYAMVEAESETRFSHPFMSSVIDEFVKNMGGPNALSKILVSKEYPPNISEQLIIRLRLLLNWWDKRLVRRVHMRLRVRDSRPDLDQALAAL
uniref:RNA-directed RNA polymerase L n=1 Tax=Fairhair virus TaxID=2034330 RepID=A0A286N5Y1_9VIRU|nr:RNA-dependent RNA-polymerase [Fairhair virus]